MADADKVMADAHSAAVEVQNGNKSTADAAAAAAAAATAATTITAPVPTAAVSALKAEEGDASMSAATSGASTPIPTMEQQALSLKVSLADLCAKGTAAYGRKEYEKAADTYAQAAEMQAEMNGEMSPENAEILFLYGRSLFKVGQAKSDVLGGKAPAPAEEKKAKKASAATNKPEEKKEEAAERAAETAAEADGKEMEKKAEEKVETEGKKPFFQFTGDDNFDDDSDEEDGEDGEEGEEDEDDMGVAFEILDLARVLFNKRLEGNAGPDTTEDKGKGKEVHNGAEMTPEVRHVKERLADTHDLLTEISWENERYAQSVTDARKSLAYKKELYGEDNEIVAEAHFKVSLALEFASVTQTQEDAKAAGGTSAVDEGLRAEAAKELENAIRCTRLNLDNKEVELATVHVPEENEVTRERIAEVKDLIAEMEQRLEDLRKPPIDLNAAIASGTGAAGGLLGALAAGSGSSQQVEEAKKNATDLSGLVRKKDKKDASPGPAANGGAAAANGASNGTKRKAEEPPAAEESKKARVEDA